MLEELRKKNVYKKDYCGRLGDNTEPICGIPDGSYDVVVIAGGFAHGHLNIQVLRQAARALKEGPYLLKYILIDYSKFYITKIIIVNCINYFFFIKVVFLSTQ